MKTRRQAKILELIMMQPIETQEEMLIRLRECGFDVTQATVSRDIKELRLVKTLTSDGKYHYSVGHSDLNSMASKFHTIFTDSVLSVDYALNTIVVKCFPGMAQAACAALDSIQWDGVVGTLAGDDTIFIITRSESHSVQLTTDLKKIIGR
ncbi:MAG: arginine repressor [Clostridia bacterium]|nr:arginine repressor [Clostridia bacterium]